MSPLCPELQVDSLCTELLGLFSIFPSISMIFSNKKSKTKSTETSENFKKFFNSSSVMELVEK